MESTSKNYSDKNQKEQSEKAKKALKQREKSLENNEIIKK